jgi:hypothetical protein
MNMPSSHLDDDALSAAVDGTLDAALGEAVHLASCAACQTRRDGLAAAREALRSAPVEPVDELTRRRLLARALDEAVPAARPAGRGGKERPAGRGGKERPWYLRPAVGGVAAALVAVLAAVPLLLNRQDSSRDLTASSTNQESATPYLGDLGDVSDPATVQAALAGLTAGGSGSTPAADSAAERDTALQYEAPAAKAARPPAAPTPAPVNAPAAQTSEPFAARQAGSGLDPGAAQRCATTLTAKEAKGSRLVATATGTYQGQPAVVVAVERSGRRTAFVMAGDCRVLTRQQL